MGEGRDLCPEVIKEMIDIIKFIKEKMKGVQDRHKKLCREEEEGIGIPSGGDGLPKKGEV